MWARSALALVLLAALAAQGERPQPLKGGIDFQGADVRALHADDFANPGMLWVARGETLWSAKRGAAGKACASCHGDAARSMKGVSVAHPKYSPALGRVASLDERINACVSGQQQAAPLAWESEELLSLSAYVSRQSRGMPIAVSVDGPARELLERGRALYFERQGQLNLACDQCHDRNWGKTLLAERLSQGHPADWPAYRLEWQSLGSLQRRLRACFFGVRAAQPAYGSRDLLALELYLMDRARGLEASAPGLRR